VGSADAVFVATAVDRVRENVGGSCYSVRDVREGPAVTATTLRCALCIVIVLFGAPGSVERMAGRDAGREVIPQPALTGTSELVRRSEFVGFVDAYPLAEDPRAAWKQWISVTRVDPLKGDLGRGAGTNQYPYIAADHRGFPGYPTWFAGNGEYLVFLHHESIEGKMLWVTTAALAIEYRPDSAGTVVGRLYDEQARRAIIVGEVRMSLGRIMSGDRLGSDAEQFLDQLLRAAALSPDVLAARDRATFEQRFEQITALAGEIRLGTRRADVEKVFPLRDGGLSVPSRQRYYAGSEVMVEAPFDQTGGRWSSENRVTGPLRVWRSYMHFD
jgi:hypothetical protein